MIGEELKPEFEEMIRLIAQRNGYYGNKISPSIMRLFEVEVREFGAGILVPYWIPVLERGRGARKSTKDHGLVKKIYAWMERRGMFKSKTAEGKFNEARFITWYINKYGNKHFRSGTFVDVYTSVRRETIEKINKKFVLAIGKITMEVI